MDQLEGAGQCDDLRAALSAPRPPPHAPASDAAPLTGEVPQGRVAAVIPAAGCGERMTCDTPKQYLEVCGRPLVTHCLEALEAVAWVARVVVVADDEAKMRDVVRRAALTKVTVIEGKGSRHRSIRAGVQALAEEEDPPAVVVVHDGVRPLLPQHTLAQVAVMAERHGAAGAVRPLVSTVVKPDFNGFLQESLVRSLYRNSETPQAFRLEVLREAYRRCSEEELDHGTECLALALCHTGVRVKLVPGTPHLWKVTEEKDLQVARTLLPRLTRTVTIVCRAVTTLPHHDATGAFTTMPQHLSCSDECLRVFAALEASLRGSCKSLNFSSSYGAPFSPHSSLVSVSNASSSESLLEYLKAAARDISTAVGTVILIFTLTGSSSDTMQLSVASLQLQVRDAFMEHCGPITVIVRGATKVLRDAREIGGSIEDQTKDSIAQASVLSPPPDSNRLNCLVMSLLDQTTRGFHGLVIVL